MKIRRTAYAWVVGLAAAASWGWTQDRTYEINGNRYEVPEEVSAIPQSGRVTVHFMNRPVTEILAELSRQSGCPLGWWGNEGPSMTLSTRNAPLLAVLGALCTAHRLDVGPVQTGEGEKLQLSPKEGGGIVRCQVAGPLLLAWYGLGTETEYNFEDPQNPRKVTRYRLGLIEDLRAHIEAGRGQPLREEPVRFLFQPGAQERELRSDHQKNIFKTGPQWKFKPDERFVGSSADIRVHLPFHAPSGLGRKTLAWREGGDDLTGKVRVTLEKVAHEKKKVRDPDDFWKEIEVVECALTFKLIHSAAGKLEELQKQGTPEALQQAYALQMEMHQKGTGALAAHEVFIVGADGTRLAARFGSADGVSGPAYGYRYEATAHGTSLDFVPKEAEIVWAQDLQFREIDLEIPGCPIR
jgi:hypothetical protein